MTGLIDKRERLEELFINQKCRVRGCLGGSETTYPKGKPIIRIISGQEFKKVIEVKITGQSSAWNWVARFTFDDETISGSFTRISDIEIEPKGK